MDVYVSFSGNDSYNAFKSVLDALIVSLGNVGYYPVITDGDGKDIHLNKNNCLNECKVNIFNEKMDSYVRDSPVSLKEVISGSKIQAFELYKNHPNKWCIGIQNGLMKSGSYSDQTDMVDTTLTIDNNTFCSGNFITQHGCKTEGSYQIALNSKCRKEMMDNNIRDLSSHDMYYITSVTVVDPSGTSITNISEASPAAYRDRDIFICKYLSSKMVEKPIQISPIINCFNSLIKIKSDEFGRQIKEFWNEDRCEMMKVVLKKHYPYPHSPFTIPNFESYSDKDVADKTNEMYWLNLA